MLKAMNHQTKIKNHPTTGLKFCDIKDLVSRGESLPEKGVLRGELDAAVREKLATYKDGSKVFGLAPVKCICVGRDNFDTIHNCLFIIYGDESVDNLSVNKLFKKGQKKQSTINATTLKAARHEILEQILAVKRRHRDGFSKDHEVRTVFPFCYKTC